MTSSPTEEQHENEEEDTKNSTLRKMEKLAETYFDSEDLQSEIYFPVSTLKTSQFYPGATTVPPTPVPL